MLQWRIVSRPIECERKSCRIYTSSMRPGKSSRAFRISFVTPFSVFSFSCCSSSAVVSTAVSLVISQSPGAAVSFGVSVSIRTCVCVVRRREYPLPQKNPAVVKSHWSSVTVSFCWFLGYVKQRCMKLSIRRLYLVRSIEPSPSQLYMQYMTLVNHLLWLYTRESSSCIAVGACVGVKRNNNEWCSVRKGCLSWRRTKRYNWIKSNHRRRMTRAIYVMIHCHGYQYNQGLPYYKVEYYNDNDDDNERQDNNETLRMTTTRVNSWSLIV